MTYFRLRDAERKMQDAGRDVEVYPNFTAFYVLQPIKLDLTRHAERGSQITRLVTNSMYFNYNRLQDIERRAREVGWTSIFASCVLQLATYNLKYILVATWDLLHSVCCLEAALYVSAVAMHLPQLNC